MVTRRHPRRKLRLGKRWLAFSAAREPTLDWVRTLIRGASPERSLLGRTTHFGSGQRNSRRRSYSATHRPKWLAALSVWLVVLRQPL